VWDYENKRLTLLFSEPCEWPAGWEQQLHVTDDDGDWSNDDGPEAGSGTILSVPLHGNGLTLPLNTMAYAKGPNRAITSIATRLPLEDFTMPLGP